MLNNSIVFGSIALLLSGISYAQNISTYPPGSPLYEAVKENLINSGNKEVSDSEIIRHINASTEITNINNELNNYFSDRLLESSIDNSRAGMPTLKIYIKDLNSADIKYVYSIKKYEMVHLEYNRFNKNEAEEINRNIAETLIKDERLIKLIRGGYYEAETDSFVVKIATGDFRAFKAALKPVQDKYKINIKFMKDESEILNISVDESVSIKKKRK